MCLIKDEEGDVFELEWCPNCNHGWMDCPDCSADMHLLAIEQGQVSSDEIFCGRCEDQRSLPCDFYCDDGVLKTPVQEDVI